MQAMIFTLILKGIDWYLDKIKADKAVRDAFVEFLKETKHLHKIPIALTYSFLDQKRRLQEMEKKK